MSQSSIMDFLRFAISGYTEKTREYKYQFKNDSGLQFTPIELKPDYAEKWNESSKDFICLVKDGQLLRETLYRVGGIGAPKPEDDYFMLMKHVEAHYTDSITKDKKRKPHLQSIWCIIDKLGNEKVVFDSGFLSHGYIVDNSQIYSIDRKYYNIETGEFYCSSSGNVESKEFLFLENRYDKDPSRVGVMKINKKDGTWELFKGYK